jgi:hypothetical protein
MVWIELTDGRHLFDEEDGQVGRVSPKTTNSVLCLARSRGQPFVERRLAFAQWAPREGASNRAFFGLATV